MAKAYIQHWSSSVRTSPTRQSWLGQEGLPRLKHVLAIGVHRPRTPCVQPFHQRLRVLALCKFPLASDDTFCCRTPPFCFLPIKSQAQVYCTAIAPHKMYPESAFRALCFLPLLGSIICLHLVTIGQKSGPAPNSEYGLHFVYLTYCGN